MFKNLRLAQQMGLGFAAVLVLLMVVAATSFWAITSASRSLVEFEHSVEVTGAVWEQQDDVSKIRINVLNNLASHDKRFIDEAHQIARELDGDIESHLATAKAEGNQALVATLTEMQEDVHLFEQEFDKINDLWSARGVQYDVMVAQGSALLELFDEVIADFTRDRSLDLLADAATAQKEMLMARLAVMKYLEKNTEQNYQSARQLMGETLPRHLGELKAGVTEAEIKEDFAQMEAAAALYTAALDEMHTLLTARNAAVEMAVNELGPELTQDLQLLKEADLQHQQALAKEAEAVSGLGVILVSSLSLAALLLGGTIAILLPRAIRKPIGGEPKAMQGIAEQIARGDLTVEFDDTGNETGIYAAMRGMTRQLTKIVGEVTDSASHVSSASSQIAAGSQELSQRTEEQASSLEETAASIEEMTSTIKQNADNAQEASQLAEGARDNALKGGEVVKRAQLAMNEISTASNQIKEIIEVIEGISFQTNLLSLNASVEAARAGEQGRGFAVVAGEVGKLASKSSDAAKDIKGLINSTVDKVEAGATLVAESGSALEDIITSVNRVTDIVAEIAAASQEQAAGIGQINKAVTQMDEVTQHNSSLVEETASAAEALNEQAAHLKQLISYFQVGGGHDGAPERPAPRQAAQAQAKPAPAARKPVERTRDNEDGWQDF